MVLYFPLWVSDLLFGLKPVFPKYVITAVLGELNWHHVKNMFKKHTYSFAVK